jgi:hypothetical protein
MADPAWIVADTGPGKPAWSVRAICATQWEAQCVLEQLKERAQQESGAGPVWMLVRSDCLPVGWGFVRFEGVPRERKAERRELPGCLPSVVTEKLLDGMGGELLDGRSLRGRLADLPVHEDAPRFYDS